MAHSGSDPRSIGPAERYALSIWFCMNDVFYIPADECRYLSLQEEKPLRIHISSSSCVLCFTDSTPNQFFSPLPLLSNSLKPNPSHDLKPSQPPASCARFLARSRTRLKRASVPKLCGKCKGVELSKVASDVFTDICLQVRKRSQVKRWVGAVAAF